MVMGTCVYHVAHRTFGNILSNMGQNAELPQFTQALYDARELAMARMQKEAEVLSAEGIVGVELVPAQPHLGLAHHRVLRHRHRGPAVASGPRDPDPAARASGWTANQAPERAGQSLTAGRAGALRSGGPAGVRRVEVGEQRGRELGRLLQER